MKLPLEARERRQAYYKKESFPEYKGRIPVNPSQEYKRDWKVDLEEEGYFEWSVVVQQRHLPGGKRSERGKQPVPLRTRSRCNGPAAQPVLGDNQCRGVPLNPSVLVQDPIIKG